MTQQLRISYPLSSFPFSLLYFSRFPVRTCTKSFFRSQDVGNVVIRIALCMTSRLKVQPASELATFGMISLLHLSVQLSELPSAPLENQHHMFRVT